MPVFEANKTKEKERVLFVFDDSSKLWHKEDNLAVKDFVVFDGEAYALTESNSIVSMTGVNGEEEEDFEWFLESGKIGFTTPYRKRIRFALFADGADLILTAPANSVAVSAITHLRMGRLSF